MGHLIKVTIPHEQLEPQDQDLFCLLCGKEYKRIEDFFTVVISKEGYGPQATIWLYQGQYVHHPELPCYNASFMDPQGYGICHECKAIFESMRTLRKVAEKAGEVVLKKEIRELQTQQMDELVKQAKPSKDLIK